jgi:hypothetical protein
MSLHSDTLSSFHVFAPFAQVDMSLRAKTWNEDNVSEWRDMSTRAKGAKTWNEDNVSEWRDMSTRAKRAKTWNDDNVSEWRDMST